MTTIGGQNGGAELDVKGGTVRRWFNVAAAPEAHFPKKLMKRQAGAVLGKMRHTSRSAISWRFDMQILKFFENLQKSQEQELERILGRF